MTTDRCDGGGKTKPLIEAYIGYRFSCPVCGKRIRLDSSRQETKSARSFTFKPCECGYKAPADTLNTMVSSN